MKETPHINSVYDEELRTSKEISCSEIGSIIHLFNWKRWNSWTGFDFSEKQRKVTFSKNQNETFVRKIKQCCNVSKVYAIYICVKWLPKCYVNPWSQNQAQTWPWWLNCLPCRFWFGSEHNGKCTKMCCRMFSKVNQLSLQIVQSEQIKLDNIIQVIY